MNPYKKKTQLWNCKIDIINVIPDVASTMLMPIVDL